MRQRLVFWRVANLGLVLGAALYFLLIPAGTLIRYLTDPNNGRPGVTRFAHDLFLDLTPKYERWARQRAQDARGEELSIDNISGTEWPLFGSVFYLWAVESLQESWKADHKVLPVEPAKYARKAVEAATNLFLDPKQAGWVRKHWGADYLTRENVFYRALRISALTSHRNLTGLDTHLPLLRQETTAFAAELDRSPTGLLDDYPGECYPGDVLMAWYVIQRAGRATGDDYSAQIVRAKRAFSGALLDRHGLVPFRSHAATGQVLGESRGCGNAYVGLCAPALWPAEARQWHERFTERFWDVRAGIRGFREYDRDITDSDWSCNDVDAGPVLAGLGVAASAFGTGAARVNGRFDQALPLTGELLLAAWPLPDGTLLLPRLLSNAIDAPYLGEAALLYMMTTQPAAGVEVRTADGLQTNFVYGVWFLYLLLGVLLAMAGIRRFRIQLRLAEDLPAAAAAAHAPIDAATPEDANAPPGVPQETSMESASRVSRRMILQRRGAGMQFYIWLGLLTAGTALFLCGWVLPASILLLISQLFPRGAVRRVTPRPR